MMPALAPALTMRAPYEDWRPPVIGVSVLVPVGAHQLLIVSGPGSTLALPTGAVGHDQSPEEAAQAVLTGLPGGLPVQRRVAVLQVQMRRRKVITHIVVTGPLTRAVAGTLTYRDPRAAVRILPTAQAVDILPERARTRALLSLQALAIGALVYVRDGEIQRLEDVRPHDALPDT
ncbi:MULTISPECIES: hypothetical protein [Streptomyces]|uniref:hypothetical protein n=1 Tax=Streptomyces sp. SYP-A7185 TaxID=3040076 RepID=UPI0038F7DB08